MSRQAVGVTTVGRGSQNRGVPHDGCAGGRDWSQELSSGREESARRERRTSKEDTEVRDTQPSRRAEVR